MDADDQGVGLRHAHRIPADFVLFATTHAAARGGGEELRTEADPQHRHLVAQGRARAARVSASRNGNRSSSPMFIAPTERDDGGVSVEGVGQLVALVQATYVDPAGRRRRSTRRAAPAEHCPRAAGSGSVSAGRPPSLSPRDTSIVREPAPARRARRSRRHSCLDPARLRDYRRQSTPDRARTGCQRRPRRSNRRKDPS